MVRHLILVLSVFAIWTGCTPAYADEKKLVEVAHLWHQVKFKHPVLINDEVDWDKALIDALPDIRAAKNDAALARALARLMAPLNDPSVRITPPHVQPLVQWTPAQQETAWIDAQTVLVHLHAGAANTARLMDSRKECDSFSASLKMARSVIIDIRPVRPRAVPVDGALNCLVTHFISTSLTLPAEQIRFQSDLKAPGGDNGESVLAGLMTLNTERLHPAPNSNALRLAFIIDQDSIVPKVITAMQAAGLAVVVSEGGLFPNRVTGFDAVPVSGLRVEFTQARLVGAADEVVLHPDMILPSDPETGAASKLVNAAKTLLSMPPSVQAVRPKTPNLVPLNIDEPPYRNLTIPDLNWRILAAIKLWSTMESFFPYKEMSDPMWEHALEVCLREMNDVNSAEDYSVALARMAAKLDDSHVRVFSKAMRSYTGDGSIGIRLQIVEGKVTVTGMQDQQLAANGVRIGDELLRIDGAPTADRVARLMPVTSGSTAAAKLRDVVDHLLDGKTGTPVTVTFARPGEPTLDVSVTRSIPASPPKSPRAGRPVFETLPGEIGYVDLDRLDPEQVDPMFRAMANTRAIIFDMRGYPHGTAWLIAPRLNTRNAKTGALFFHQMTGAHPMLDGARLEFPQILPPALGPIYRGQVVMLINEETQSQAEHTGLLFEAATPVIYIGTPSAGADGDIRNTALPGGVFVSFSGYGVRHADGHPLQRIGLQPDIIVAPTLNGLRHGTDEVLERALDLLH